jgi:hypothetical protein
MISGAPPRVGTMRRPIYAIFLYRDNGGAAADDTAKRYMRRVSLFCLLTHYFLLTTNHPYISISLDSLAEQVQCLLPPSPKECRFRFSRNNFDYTHTHKTNIVDRYLNLVFSQIYLKIKMLHEFSTNPVKLVTRKPTTALFWR